MLCAESTDCIAPIDQRHDHCVPPELRAGPVAARVTPDHMVVYQGIAKAAARAGTIWRAFLSREEARLWVREQARAPAANRVWWPGHRALPQRRRNAAERRARFRPP